MNWKKWQKKQESSSVANPQPIIVERAVCKKKSFHSGKSSITFSTFQQCVHRVKMKPDRCKLENGIVEEVELERDAANELQRWQSWQKSYILLNNYLVNKISHLQTEEVKELPLSLVRPEKDKREKLPKFSSNFSIFRCTSISCTDDRIWLTGS